MSLTHILCWDWSGAADEPSQRNHIWLAWVTIESGVPRLVALQNGLTRQEVFSADSSIKGSLRWLLSQLPLGEQAVLGWDFAFGYPAGFWKQLGFPVDSWDDCLSAAYQYFSPLENGGAELIPAVEKLNKRLSGNPEGGPFWWKKGMRSSFPWAGARFQELRLTDRGLGAKSPFQLVGVGQVGRQVIRGLPYLHQLRNDPQLSPRLHFFPADGWKPPPGKHVVVEIYPSLYPEVPLPNWVKTTRATKADAQAALRSAYAIARSLLRGNAFQMPESPAKSPANRQRVEQEEYWIWGAG